MEETNESTMDIDGDGASDDTAMEQQIPNEPSKKLNLSEFPKELLEQILIHLNDKELLTASHVCKSFANAAEMAFAQKYSKNYYNIKRWDKMEKFHKIILAKYGGKIRLLFMDYQDEELLSLIVQKCCSLKSVTFDGTNPEGFKMIPMLKGLKEIRFLSGLSISMFGRRMNWNRDTFTEFINNNPELEAIDINRVNSDLLDILDGRLDMLKSLTLREIHGFKDLPKIRLKSLEKLKMKSVECVARLLQAMNSNPIKVLDIENYDCVSGTNIQEICEFKSLVSLRLEEYASPIPEDQLKKLAAHLPHLTELSMAMGEILSSVANNIQSVLSILPKLTKLTLSLDEYDFRKRISKYLKTSIDDFHACFANTNTEIQIIDMFNTVSTSKDRIYVCNSESCTIELYWMENLNETSVRKVIDGLRHPERKPTFEFINNCANQNFDISALMHPKLKEVDCLIIESNGPITVNANATRYPDFFPSLKILKIFLENHSAINFLRKLDKKVCKNIKKLWLSSKSFPGNQEVEPGADITSDFIKFENLETVHMNPSFELNSGLLFTVCQKLKDLHILREL